jgi:transcriptional regulator with XRE-family HTH domain
MSLKTPVLGQRIREERRRRGLSQTVLAAAVPRIGSRARMSAIENGTRKIDSLVLYDLAATLSVPMDAFFDKERGRLLTNVNEPREAQAMTDWALELLADMDFVEREVAAHGW